MAQSTAIIDIQYVLNAASKYLIKEMSVVDTETFACQHFIFKTPLKSQNAKSKSVNRWLFRNYHQISLEYGDIEYEEIDRILNSLRFERIYVRGEQKRQIINEIIPHVDVQNIELLGCPRLNQLTEDSFSSSPATSTSPSVKQP